MAATPTAIRSSNFTSESTLARPITSPIDYVAGQLLVAHGATEDSSVSLGTPTGGAGLTWTQHIASGNTSKTHNFLWTAIAASTQTAQTITTAISSSGSSGGLIVEAWPVGCTVGTVMAVAAGTGAPLGNITTTTAGSAVSWSVGDWAAIAGARTRRTVNGSTGTESHYTNFPSRASYHGGYYSDVGAAGAKAVGLTAPTGQDYILLALEVKTPAGTPTASGPSSATVKLNGTVSGRKVASLPASGTIKTTGTVTGRKNGRAAVAGVLRLAGTALGPLHFGVRVGESTLVGEDTYVGEPPAPSAATLRLGGAVTGRKTASNAVTGALRTSTSSAGFKRALSTHEEAALVPPFTQLVDGAIARLQIQGTVAGVRQAAASAASSALVRFGGAASGRKTASAPASATVRTTGTATGAKTARASIAGTLRATTTVTGRKAASSAASSLLRFTAAVTGTGQEQHSGSATGIFRIAATATGRKNGVGPASASVRVAGAATGRKTAAAPASALLRALTTAAGFGTTPPAVGSGSQAVLRFTSTATGRKAATAPGSAVVHLVGAAIGAKTARVAAGTVLRLTAVAASSSNQRPKLRHPLTLISRRSENTLVRTEDLDG